MLQEKEIENANEYVFALSAHSSYWTQKDLSLFIARQVFRCRNGAYRDEEGGISEKLEVSADNTYIPYVLREDEAVQDVLPAQSSLREPTQHEARDAAG